MKMTTKSGNAISRIALGTGYFGTSISPDHSRKVVDTYLSLGGNQLDTARCYANWIPGGEGASERTVGLCMKQYRREDIFLGTKGGIAPRGFNETRGDLSRGNIESDLNTSLETLQVDYIDIYWLHRDDYRYSVGEIVEMMNDFISEGKIRYYGVSNWTSERLIQADEYAAAHGLEGISASQIQYGLGICTPGDWGDESVICMNEREYEQYKKLGKTVYAYSAQAEGYFSIYLSRGAEALGADTRQKYDTPVNRNRAEMIRQLQAGKDFSLSWMMAEYVLSSPFPTVFLMGGGNLARIREIMELYARNERQLSEEDWNQIISIR